MQPYQKASEEIRRQGEFPANAIKTAGSLAVRAIPTIGGGLALGKVLPFLSKYIPEDLAIKGLSKIDPRFGKFIKMAMSNGKSFDEAKEFIREKAEGSQEQSKENRNIIEQYSPELHQFILGEIQNGRKPIEAAALAQNDKRFSNVIKKLEKDHKTNWSNIIQSTYGVGETAQPQQMQQQPSSQQIGPGQQALMQVLQKINQKLGGQQ